MFDNLKELLEDEDIRVREACAWAFYRLSVNEDGCSRMVGSSIPEFMIMSFIQRSEPQLITYEDGQYLIYLLNAFVNLTFSDNGIEPLLGKDAVTQFIKILDDQSINTILGDKYPKVAELCLRVIGNMSINQDGKDECIENLVIARSFVYLADLPERSYEDALNTSLILMSCSIHLEGKNQIVDQVDDAGNPIIIQTIISRLESLEFPDLRKNLIVALTNVAELPRGFEEITRQLLTNIKILDEVFGARAVKPLHNFLPKLSDYDEENLAISKDDAMRAYPVIFALSFLFKKYKEVAADVAINETINFAEKLAPFINPEFQVQEEVGTCLSEVLTNDSYNCHILQKFIHKYGGLPVKNQSTLKQEMFQKFNDIF